MVVQFQNNSRCNERTLWVLCSSTVLLILGRKLAKLIRMLLRVERWESLIRKVVSLMVVFIILRNHNSHIGGPGVLLECWSVVCHALVKGPSVLCGHIE